MILSRVSLLTPSEIEEIKKTGLLNKKAQYVLGGQSGGFFFFCHPDAVQKQIEMIQDENQIQPEQKICILTSTHQNPTYPDWKLDTESSATELFEIIYKHLRNNKIQLPDKTNIQTAGDKIVICNDTFKKYSSFTGAQSGLIEKICDFLCQSNQEFKSDYIQIFQDVINGKIKHGAIKTTTPVQIKNIKIIENQNNYTYNQTDKFYNRYKGYKR